MFMKRLNNFVDARLQDATAALISIGSRVNSLESRTAILEKESASSEIQRWQTGQIKGIQDRLKDLETRTTPPAGLDDRLEITARDAVVAYVASQGKPVNLLQMVRDLSVTFTEAGIRNGAKWAVNSGRLVRLERGVYAVPSKQAQRLQQIGSPRQVNQRV
jgi:hypothetical protein